jgi:ADP-ribose pyrophosphatase YjhB (NUDIX family)
MAKGRGKGKQTVADKLNELDPSFLEEAATLDNVAVKEKMFSLTHYAMELEETRANDEDLKQLQDRAREAAKLYSEPLTANKLKRKYLLQILKERGVIA